MRKIILSMMLSADGCFEAPGHDISWHNWSPEMSDYMAGFFETVDTILMGRKNYEQMAAYWPRQAAYTHEPVIADRMNSMPKIIFSNTLTKPGWQNCTIMRGDLAKQLNRLKTMFKF